MSLLDGGERGIDELERLASTLANAADHADGAVIESLCRNAHKTPFFFVRTVTGRKFATANDSVTSSIRAIGAHSLLEDDPMAVGALERVTAALDDLAQYREILLDQSTYLECGLDLDPSLFVCLRFFFYFLFCRQEHPLHLNAQIQ